MAYGIFHFGFHQGGEGQLYKINDRIAFELQTPNEYSNGVFVRSYRPTNAFVKFICGNCEYDMEGAVEMVNIKYRSGDCVYTDFPQHEIIPTDIINLRTGEAVEANVPADFKTGGDFSRLAEYRTRNLTAGEQFRLDQNYIKANFQALSTFTDRCFYAHLIFIVAALFLTFPKLFVWIIVAFVEANDPSHPENYYRISTGD